MLGLKLATDPRWVNIVESNIEEILTDHAWCEQKAATNAINLIINNSEKPDLVAEMLKISENTSKTQYSRARQMLRKMIEETYEKMNLNEIKINGI